MQRGMARADSDLDGILAAKGSEPARSGFIKARILFCRDAEIEGIPPRIPVFRKHEKEEKLLPFYADFWLNYYYFLKSCSIEGYMKMRTIAEIIYSLYRMILQENLAGQPADIVLMVLDLPVAVFIFFSL